MEKMDSDLKYITGKILEKPFSMELGINLLLNIAWAVEEIHELGLIHSDLKPANIFIKHNTFPDIKIGDFGFTVSDGPIVGYTLEFAPYEFLKN